MTWIFKIINSNLKDPNFLIIANGSYVQVSFFSHSWVKSCTVDETWVIDLSDKEKSIIVLVIEPVTILSFFVLQIPNFYGAVSRGCDQEPVVEAPAHVVNKVIMAS